MITLIQLWIILFCIEPVSFFVGPTLQRNYMNRFVTGVDGSGRGEVGEGKKSFVTQ